jgi:hypothetical protein
LSIQGSTTSFTQAQHEQNSFLVTLFAEQDSPWSPF